jgi:acyl carrier protein
MSDIASRVKAIIVDKLGVDDNEVTTEASFTNDLGADSLDTVELIMEFEKEFDIQIPDDQAENIGTVGQAVSYIEEAKKINLYAIKASCSNWTWRINANRK